MSIKEQYIRDHWPHRFNIEPIDAAGYLYIELYDEADHYFAGCGLHKDADMSQLQRFISDALEELNK